MEVEMTALPTTKDRVPRHTADNVNARLSAEMEARIRHLAAHPDRITERIAALEAEWDIERAIEANAATLALIGVALGFFAHPYWLFLPALVTMFLLQHALQGWCPPVPVLRRLGFRTVYEIERERHALKALRGDFALVEREPDKAAAALQAAA
jgi:hypothetical protein